MNPIDSANLRVVQQLEKLKSVPRRDEQRAQAGRAAFLQEARELAQAVSAPAERRRIGWKQKLLTRLTTRKERSAMFSTLTTLILALTMVLGGGGITLASAQNSLPDQPLYSLKLWSEEVRFNLTADPQTTWQLAQSFTERRAVEIQAMLAAGRPPSQAVQERYQSQVEQSIRLAAGLQDELALPALQQTRQKLRLQEQAFSQVQIQNDPQTQAIRERMRLMLQERLNWVEAGIERQQHRNGSPIQPPAATEQPEATTNSPANPTSGAALPGGPGTGDAGSPWMTGMPTPGSGYGPGPGDGSCNLPEGTCGTPFGGQGGNPWTTGTPTPGSSYGPGPGPTQDTSGSGGNTQQPKATQSPAKTRPAQPNSTQSQTQSTPKGPGPQKTPGGGKNGG
jgi:hypothetical protein